MHEGWQKFLVWFLTALPLVLMIWQFKSKTKGDWWHQARAWGVIFIPVAVIIWNSIVVEKFTWDLPYMLHLGLGFLYFTSCFLLLMQGLCMFGWPKEEWYRNQVLQGIRRRHRMVAKIAICLYIAQAVAAMMIPTLRTWLA